MRLILITTLVLMMAYSLVLIGVELRTSQDFVRNFFTDIEGPVPFYAVNTTLSVFLLWATSLIFLVCFTTTHKGKEDRTARWFFLTQVVVFAYLGCDDRFRIHENLGWWLEIPDHYVLLVFAVAEAALLALLGLRVLERRALSLLAIASVLFGIMFAIDAWMPHMMVLRLTLEDLAKTWAALFFFLFSWSTLEQRLERLRHMRGSSAVISERHRKVLVLGNDNRSILAILRSLGRKGIDVHVGWCPPAAPALRSRYLKQAHQLPPFDPDDDTWYRSLAGLLAREEFELVIPATDYTVLPCQLRARELEPHGRIYLLEPRAFEIARHKEMTYKLAAELGIPVPRTIVIRTEHTATRDLDLCFPAVVKPDCSVGLYNIRKKDFVRKVYNHDELEAHLRALSPSQERILIQNFVPGHGAGIELLAHKGKLLFAFQHDRLHETTGYGSTYRESMPLDPRLLDASRKLMQALEYTGVAMVEFRVSPEDGIWHLIEINARFWGSLPLPVASGADFPYFLYQLLIKGKRDFDPGYRTGVRCRNLKGEVGWFWRNLRNKPGDLGCGMEVNRVPRRQLILDFGRFVTFRDHLDTFSRDDPYPALYETARMCGSGMMRLIRLLSRGLRATGSGAS